MLKILKAYFENFLGGARGELLSEKKKWSLLMKIKFCCVFATSEWNKTKFRKKCPGGVEHVNSL